MSPRERLTFGHGAHLAVPAPPIAIAAALAHEPQPVRLTRVETWDWGWGGLLMFTVFLFLRPQDQIPGLGNSHLSDLAAFVGLGAMVFLNLSRGKPITRVTPELIALAAVGGVILLTTPFSFWPGGSFQLFTDIYVPSALIFMLMVNSITSPRRIQRICWVIVVAFGYMSIRVIFNYVRGINLLEGRAVGPVGGFFENPNDLALNLVSFLPLAMMYVKRPGSMVKRLIFAAICVLMLTASVFAKSRGGTLGAIAMIATFLVVSRSLTPATLIAIVFAGMVVMPALPQSFWDRMASITESENEDGSRAERRMLMQRGWTLFLENPLTGIGAGQFRNYVSPTMPHRNRETHNVLLQVGSEIGMLGVIAFAFFIGKAFTASWWTRQQLSWIYRKRSRKRSAPSAEPEDGLEPHERDFLETHRSAMFAGMVGWFVCGMFASVAFNWTIYYMVGLSIAARDVFRHRAAAYAEAKRLTTERIVAA